MTELLTATQMRTIEQAAIDSGDVTGLELMERAGQGVVEAIFEEWPEYKTAPQSACVLCGPGNNGGDGFVVARLLKAKGWVVRVLLLGDVEKLPKDAKSNATKWLAENQIEELTTSNFRRLPDTLVIDALFGSGLTRPLVGEAEEIILRLSGRFGDDFSNNLVAIDTPSGLCLDSGKAVAKEFQGLNSCERNFACLTVTFDSPKAGHFLNNGPRLCGKVIVKDIGLKNWRCFDLGKKYPKSNKPFVMKDGAAIGSLRFPQLVLNCRNPIVPDDRHQFAMHRFDDWFRFLQKYVSHHKYTYGHAVVCSGPATKTGAARLAARAALRIGAGLVTVASPSQALSENAAQLTAIMLREANSVDQIHVLLSDERISSICIGPGLARESEAGGLDYEHTRKIVKAVLNTRKKLVLDADGLSAFAQSPDDLFQHLHENCVLTPHEGEFKRLFPDIYAKFTAPITKGPAYSKVDATREAAQRAGCTVLFKGPDTVIADASGRASINSAQYERSAPWLATAGSGDVLAGFITGLLARGLAPKQSAETAAWIHVECALKFGPGLIAEDIAEQLPSVMRDLGF